MPSSTVRSAFLVSTLLVLGALNANAAVTSPEAGIPLPPGSVTVNWESTATEYWVRVSDLADGKKFYDSGRLSAETLTITFDVPSAIVDIDITFYQKLNGDWISRSQLHDVSGDFGPPDEDMPPPMDPPEDARGAALTSQFAICDESIDGETYNEGYFCAADCPENFLAIAVDTPFFNNGDDGYAYAVEGFGTPTVAVYPQLDREVSAGEIVTIGTRYYYTCIRGYSVNESN